MHRIVKSALAFGIAFALCLSPLVSGAQPAVKPLPPLPPESLIGIGRGADHAKATRDAIANAGGLAGIVKKGDVVLIKPNLCTGARADEPKTTDYRVVAAIVDAVKALDPSRIIIAEGAFSGDAFSKEALAQNKYGSIRGVEFYNFNACEKKDCYEVTPPKSLIGKSLFIPKIFMDADVVIEAPKMKTHFQPAAVVSLTIKNSFGVPSEKIYGGYGYKNGLHNFPLSEIIVELNKIRLPGFTVIDGVMGGEGYGPSNNTPVKSEIVIAGRDPLAADVVALTFMGFTLDQIPHLQLAAKEGLGNSKLSKIKVAGADLDAIKMDFKSSFKVKR
jgi:uncharacterized protein (DUF362 family)